MEDLNHTSCVLESKALCFIQYYRYKWQVYIDVYTFWELLTILHIMRFRKYSIVQQLIHRSRDPQIPPSLSPPPSVNSHLLSFHSKITKNRPPPHWQTLNPHTQTHPPGTILLICACKFLVILNNNFGFVHVPHMEKGYVVNAFCPIQICLLHTIDKHIYQKSGDMKSFNKRLNFIMF